MRRFPILLLLALTVAACDSGSDDAPRLSGLYIFSKTETDFTPPATVTLALDLSTSAGSFTLGSGSYYRISGAETAQATVTGSGTYAPPSITLRLDAIDLGEGFVIDAATFTGTASASGDVLTLTSDGETLTLRRQ
jgi:hypothetical protein